MTTTVFSPAELADYERDGYFLARGLFDRSEIQKLLEFAQNDPVFQQTLYGRKDAAGMETKLALWNQAGDDLYSMFARSPPRCISIACQSRAARRRSSRDDR